MPNRFDKTITLSLQTLRARSSLVHWLGLFGAQPLILLEGAAAVILLWMAYLSDHPLQRTAEFFLTVLFAWIATFVLEYLVNRPRPYEAMKFVPATKPGIETPSFPSAHATIAFAIAGWATLHLPSASGLFLAVACAIAIARVVVGVHYLTDVVAGMLIGLAVPLLIYSLSL